MKVYHLFETPSGGVSNYTADYCGSKYTVAATNLRQAMALVYKNVWVEEPGEDVGILSAYVRGHGYTLWCGCDGHNLNFHVEHLKGKRAIREAVARHLASGCESTEQEEDDYYALHGINPEEDELRRIEEDKIWSETSDTVYDMLTALEEVEEAHGIDRVVWGVDVLCRCGRLYHSRSAHRQHLADAVANRLMGDVITNRPVDQP